MTRTVRQPVPEPPHSGGRAEPASPAAGPGADPAATVTAVLRALLARESPLEARISPDGAAVAVTVAGPGGSGIRVVSADGAAAADGGPRPVGAHAEGSAPTADLSRPRWLPGSRLLLAVAEPRHAGAAPRDGNPGDGAGEGGGTGGGGTGGGGFPELVVLDASTGRRAPLARVPGAVEDLLLSDDGTEVLLLTADDGAERDGMNLGVPVRLGGAPDPERHRPRTGWRRLLHGRLPGGAALAALLDREPGPKPAPQDAPGAAVSLRDAGPRGLTVWNAAWRGGRTVVATVSDEPLPAGYYHARFAAVDLGDGTARTLYRPKGQLTAPALAADGRTAAVVEGISIVAGRPVVVDLDGTAVTAPTSAEDVTWLRFDPADASRLLTAGWAGTGSRVADVRLDGLAPGGARTTERWRAGAVLGGPRFQPSLSLAAAGTRAAAVLEAPGLPPQAVVAETGGPDAWSWRPVTRLGARGAAGTGVASAAPARDGDALLRTVRTRELSWASADGRPVHSLLLDAPGVPAPHRPAASSSPATRPLAVVLHGGPSWQWSAGYAPGDVVGLAPALAAAGWLVLLPNPRGSSGYGLAHARAVIGEFGGRDLDDVLAGVDTVTRSGEAEPGRAAVLGHSYGGFLAAVAAARTDVFRAAVVVSAPTDWLSFSHTSVIGGGYETVYGIGDASTPEGRAALLDRSPVFAAAGGPATAPMLLLHGAEDRVTPVSQAQELYRAVARRGDVPVELYVYPGEGHEFTDPDHLLDAAARAAAWLTDHVAAPGDRSETPAGPPEPSGPDGLSAPPGPGGSGVPSSLLRQVP